MMLDAVQTNYQPLWMSKKDGNMKLRKSAQALCDDDDDDGDGQNGYFTIIYNV